MHINFIYLRVLKKGLIEMGRTTFNMNYGNYNPVIFNSNYTRYNAYNQMTPYMMNLYSQRGGFYPMYGMGQQQQSFEVKTSFGEELGTMIGTLEREHPGTLKKCWEWCKDTAFPAIGKAATWAWNGITSLFSKKGAATEEA